MAGLKKYSVPMTGYANITVDVETDETDPVKIAELAQEAIRAHLCHECAGERNDSLELVGEWDPVIGEDGKPEVCEI